MVSELPKPSICRGSSYGRVAPFLASLLCCAAVLCCAAAAEAKVTVEQTGDYVLDTANVIDPATETEISGWLQQIEDKTTDQVKVLTVPTIDGEDFVGFAQRHYDLWKLGKKDKGNGALIVLAVQEHKIRIHTGYGLEGVLPDSWCGSLSRKIAQEYFKRGAYSDGLKQLVIAVVNRIADDAGIKLGTPQFRHQEGNADNNGLVLLVILIVMIIIFYSYWQQSRMQRGGRGFGGTIGPFPPSIYVGPWDGSFGGGSSGGGTFGGGSWGGGGMSGGGGGGASWCAAPSGQPSLQFV
jgi:uncharacterized protein